MSLITEQPARHAALDLAALPIVAVIALGSVDELEQTLAGVIDELGYDGYRVVVHVPTSAAFDPLLARLVGAVDVLRSDLDERAARASLEAFVRDARDLARDVALALGAEPPRVRSVVVVSGGDREHQLRARDETAVARDVFQRFAPDRLFTDFEHRERSVHPDSFDPGRPRWIVSDVRVPLRTQLLVGEAISGLDSLTDDEVRGGVFFVYFTCDSDAVASLDRIRRLGGTFVPHLWFGKTEYRWVDRRAHDAMQRTWAHADRVSHLVPIVHENICEALAMVDDLEGDYVEVGVFLGGSALTALNFLSVAAAQDPDGCHARRRSILLDTFDGFDYAEADDSPDAIWAGTHKLFGAEQTMAHVDATLGTAGVPFRLVRSNVCQEPLPADVTRIAVANVDVDMYEPTLAALHAVAPLMVPGGVVIAEDPASTPGLYGALLAMHEFLASEAGRQFTPIFKHGQYFLLRHR